MVYNGSEELESNSKFGQGHYTYVGNIVKDGGLWSAIYGQSENNPGGQSVILRDWQGPMAHWWIGLVLTVLP